MAFLALKFHQQQDMGARLPFFSGIWWPCLDSGAGCGWTLGPTALGVYFGHDLISAFNQWDLSLTSFSFMFGSPALFSYHLYLTYSPKDWLRPSLLFVIVRRWPVLLCTYFHEHNRECPLDMLGMFSLNTCYVESMATSLKYSPIGILLFTIGEVAFPTRIRRGLFILR